MKKKNPVKRKYVKKSPKRTTADSKKAIEDIQFVQPVVNQVTPKAELDEIEFLDAVVTGVEQMNNEQRSRFINYIYSRYRVYITLSKLTQ
jgi:hypothetical protein